MKYVSPFVIAITLLSFVTPVQASPTAQRPVLEQHSSRAGIGANGRSFVVLPPFPSPQPSVIGNIVFSPNGTAYFTDANNEIASFTRAGVYSRISVPHAVRTDTLLYAHGVFWMAADHGIVKVAPDGSRRRWYELSVPGNDTYVESLTAGPDGGIYVLAVLYSKTDGTQTNLLFRIGTSGAVTTAPLSVTPAGARAAAFGADNLLYFGYSSPNSVGIARLELNGSITLFPIAGLSQPSNFVLSKGNIYFDNIYVNNRDGRLGRITPAGTVSLIAFPATGPNTDPSPLAVDQGGNLWVVVDNGYAIGQYYLYQYNVYTGHFNGPYLTGLPNVLYGGPVVAPDNSVWVTIPNKFFQPIGFGVFVNGT